MGQGEDGRSHLAAGPCEQILLLQLPARGVLVAAQVCPLVAAAVALHKGLGPPAWLEGV